MPRGNFKSITMNTYSYDKFQSIYNELKEMDKLPFGVHSFSAYVEYKMFKYLEEKKLLENIANKIDLEHIPKKFVTTQVIINPRVSTPRTKW